MQNKDKSNNVIKKTQAKKISKMRLRRQKSILRAEQRKNISTIESEHGESEENDVKRNIENLRMALHAIEGKQIEKETRINRILNVSVEIQDTLGEISQLKTDMATVKDYIQRLESVIDSKEKIHACLQKQSDFVGEHTTKNTYENFESKVVDLRS